MKVTNRNENFCDDILTISLKHNDSLEEAIN